MVEQKLTQLKPGMMKRRSQRLVLNVPVVVHRQPTEGPPFNEGTHTLVLSAHGALLSLTSHVAPEQTLVLQNAASGEEVVCRVVYTEKNLAGRPEVAVEFKQPAPRFWHIAFPPSDWTPTR